MANVKVKLKPDGHIEKIWDIDEEVTRWWDRAQLAGKVQGGKAGEAMLKDFLVIAGSRLTVFDNKIVDTDTGASLDVVCEKLVADRDFYHPIKITSEGADCFGEHPSLRAQGAYVRKYGQEAFEAEAARWQVDLKNARLKPGIVPEGENQIGEKPEGERDPFVEPKANPFLHLRDSKTGAIDPRALARVQSLMKSPGIKMSKIAELAKSAGVTIDGRPLRK